MSICPILDFTLGIAYVPVLIVVCVSRASSSTRKTQKGSPRATTDADARQRGNPTLLSNAQRAVCMHGNTAKKTQKAQQRPIKQNGRCKERRTPCMNSRTSGQETSHTRLIPYRGRVNFIYPIRLNLHPPTPPENTSPRVLGVLFCKFGRVKERDDVVSAVRQYISFLSPTMPTHHPQRDKHIS